MEDDRDEMEEEEDDWMDTRWAEPGSCHMITTNGEVSSVNTSENIGTSTSETPAPARSGQGAELMTRMQLNDNKAGMEGLDKEKINQVIFEASKGSKYFENETKKEEQVKKRILEQQMKQDKITETQLKQGLEEADKLLSELEESRDLSHTIVHIDMDAFYAAVEMRDDPSLRDKPMAVGGIGMLSTSNYLARKFGVRAAMPGFIGMKLCPELVIVKANYKQYNVVSQQVRHILGQYDPNFSPMSLDEAYLDITEHLKKRQTMSDSQRSFLLRSCDNLDSTLCVCDLNEGIINPNKCIPENQSQVDQSIGFQTGISIDTEKDQLSSVTRDQSEMLISAKNQSEMLISAKNQSESPMKNSDQSESSTLTFEVSGQQMKNQSKESSGTMCSACGKPFPPYITEVFGATPEEAVREMRSRIEQKTRLTASAGIAPNTMLAKVCSDRNKPNGQYRIQPTRQAVMDFIQDLPIRKISGIGKVSETMLRALGVVKCPDLYRKRDLLYHLYSPISFNHFMHICLAIGSTTVERDGERKSMSTERTFRELSRPSDLYRKCSELCAALVEDLTEEELRGKTVAIKIKTVKFEVKTRAHSLPHHTADYEDIFKAARELLRVEIQAVQPQPLRLRLMGVRLSNLLYQSMCEEKKQDTITGLFKKMAARSPQKMQNKITRPEQSRDSLPLLPSLDLDSACVEDDHQVSHVQNTLASNLQNSENKTLATHAQNRSSTAGETHILDSHEPDRAISSRESENLTIFNPQGGSCKTVGEEKIEGNLNEGTISVPVDSLGPTSVVYKQRTVKMLFKPKGKDAQKEINNNNDLSDVVGSLKTKTLVPGSKESICNPEILTISSNELGVEKNIENIGKSRRKGNGRNSAKSVDSMQSRTITGDCKFENMDRADTKTSKRERIENSISNCENIGASLDSKDYKKVVDLPANTPAKTKKKPGRKKKSSTVSPEIEESSGYESSMHSDEKSNCALVEPASVKKKGKKTKNQNKKMKSSNLGTLKEEQNVDATEISLRPISEEQTKPENSQTHRVTSANTDAAPKAKTVPKETQEVQNLKQFQCPVCQRWIESKNLNYFNDHVDVCLFRQISSQEAEEQPHDVENTSTQETNRESQSYTNGSKSKSTTDIHSKESYMNTSKHLTDQPMQKGHTTYSKEGSSTSFSRFNQTRKSDLASTSLQMMEHSNLTNVGIGVPKTSDQEAVSAKMSAMSTSKKALSSTEIGLSKPNQNTPSSNVNEMSKSRQDAGSSRMADISTSNHNTTDAKDVSPGEHVEAEFYACPICNVEKLGCSLQDFNEHVDSCLSRRAIKQILQEQKNLPASPPAVKRVASASPSQPPAKRRKSDLGSKTKTIDSFFKS